MADWIILRRIAAAVAFAVLSSKPATAAISWGMVIIIFRVICSTSAAAVSSRWRTGAHTHIYRQGNCVL